jgi:hypothetical protein
MQLNRNRLYLFFILSAVAGYIWLLINSGTRFTPSSAGSGICFIKTVFGIPCPSCGSTRSLIHLFQGEIADAIRWNPLGIVLFPVMTIFPLWILFDWISKRSSFYLFYRRVELFIRQKYVATILVILLIANWVWNFYKGY